MKRLIIVAALGFFFCLTLVGGTAYSQATFKIPFKFRADGKPYSPGTYWFAQKEGGTILFRRETGEEEVLIPYIERLTLPDQPVEEPQLVFDMVGNFEPSYTEYITEYVLAEVWLTEKDGFLILSTERSEYKKSVKGEKAEK